MAARSGCEDTKLRDQTQKNRGLDKNGNIFISINHFKELLKDWFEYGMPRKDELKIT